MNEQLERVERTELFPEMENAPRKKRKVERPSYKGINENMQELLAEKGRTIEALKKENESLKQALKLFIG